MMKKFFKILLMGIFMDEDVQGIAKLFLGLGWCPTTVMLVLKALNITLSEGEGLVVYFGSLAFGIFFSIYVSHCIEAVKYSERYDCSLTEAWNSTGGDGDDY